MVTNVLAVQVGLQERHGCASDAAVHSTSCVEIKNHHNTITIENRTHVNRNFFDYKDLENNLQ